MNTNQQTNGNSELQNAIWRVALSLDSLLLNGIPFCILSDTAPAGFMKKLANDLLGDVAALEACVQKLLPESPHASSVRITELRALVEQMFDAVTRLTMLASMMPTDVVTNAAQIDATRKQCIAKIEELEALSQISEPFYKTRSKDSAEAMDSFLANLEKALEEKRKILKSQAAALPA